MEIMNLNENQVQIIDSLKTEFLRINESNKQHKVGKLIDFNQMASDKEVMRKKRDENRAISKANKSKCKEEFYKAIAKLNEDLNYVGLEFARYLEFTEVRCKSEVIATRAYEIKFYMDKHHLDYEGYFKAEYHDLDTFRFNTNIIITTHEGSSYASFNTIEELANSSEFVQFVKDNGDFDSADIQLSDQKEVSHV